MGVSLPKTSCSFANPVLRPSVTVCQKVPSTSLKERKQAVKDIPPPQGLKPLRMFLGLVSYCGLWIRNASMLMQPLYDCLASDPFSISGPAEDSFYSLKLAILSTPALGIPDYDQPFNLFCSELSGHITSVLTQKHRDRQRQIAYLSAILDPVSCSAPSSVRAVAAVQLMVEKALEVVLDYHPLVVQTPHDIHGILRCNQSTYPWHA